MLLEQIFIAEEIRINRDPFDGLICAAALTLALPLVTRDSDTVVRKSEGDLVTGGSNVIESVIDVFELTRHFGGYTLSRSMDPHSEVRLLSDSVRSICEDIELRRRRSANHTPNQPGSSSNCARSSVRRSDEDHAKQSEQDLGT